MSDNVAELAQKANVYVDEQGIRYWIEAVFEDEGYFRAVSDGQEFEIDFDDVDLDVEYFMALTRL